jgi:hypothetical protein
LRKTGATVVQMSEAYVSTPAPAEPVRKLRFREPRRNLPGRKAVASPEDRFTINFSRAYLANFKKIHHGTKHSELACAREIPVNGYGIADLLAVSWGSSNPPFDSVAQFLKSGGARCRAFECKLTDWKKAMSQAARYRYFAHQAVVVLPEATCQRALPYIDTFRTIRVGLWSYDPSLDRIIAYHTPRPISPKSERYFVHSVMLLQKATRRALPIR